MCLVQRSRTQQATGVSPQLPVGSLPVTALRRYITRRYVPGAMWIGVGHSLLTALAADEILGAIGVGFGAALVFTVLAVVADRVFGSMFKAVLGPIAAFTLVANLVRGHNCFGLASDSTSTAATGLVVAVAFFAWLFAVVIANRMTLKWVQSFLSLSMALFGLLELGLFLLSPAGIPLVAAFPIPAAAVSISAVLGASFFVAGSPGTTLEVLGWVVAMTQVFVTGWALSSSALPCADLAFTTVGLLAAATIASFAITRIAPWAR